MLSKVLSLVSGIAGALLLVSCGGGSTSPYGGGGGGGTPPADCASSGASATITATASFTFSPSTATISAGQKVCWVNNTGIAHTGKRSLRIDFLEHETTRLEDEIKQLLVLRRGARYRLPNDALTFMITSLLSPVAKIEAAKLLVRIRFLDAQKFANMTAREKRPRESGEAVP